MWLDAALTTRPPHPSCWLLLHTAPCSCCRMLPFALWLDVDLATLPPHAPLMLRLPLIHVRCPVQVCAVARCRPHARHLAQLHHLWQRQLGGAGGVCCGQRRAVGPQLATTSEPASQHWSAHWHSSIHCVGHWSGGASAGLGRLGCCNSIRSASLETLRLRTCLLSAGLCRTLMPVAIAHCAWSPAACLALELVVHEAGLVNQMKDAHPHPLGLTGIKRALSRHAQHGAEVVDAKCIWQAWRRRIRVDE